MFKRVFCTIFLTFIFGTAFLFSIEDYPYNPYVPLDVWIQLEPFFLPIDHPIKSRLDRIFNAARVTLSPETFEKDGFGRIRPLKPKHVGIVQHRSLPGWILKVFLDSHPPYCEWCNWLKRIKGAAAIEDCIKRHQFERYFCVPKKWIYPLPAEPSPPFDIKYNRKNFILVVEDMRLLKQKDNFKTYRTKPTKKLLKALYTVMQETGLGDVHGNNIPFNQEGKIAFIDTEHYFKWPVDFSKLHDVLSPAMSQCWSDIIQKSENREN